MEMNMCGHDYNETKAERNCSSTNLKYPSIIGVNFTVPEWEAAVTATVLSLMIIFTIVGNTLVILSVFTHKPLQQPQNYFLSSLAVADLTVAVFVLPLSIVDQLLGYWKFGSVLCKMWLTCDILCCTASILHLCVIALDRYWAITDPLNYAQKRSAKRVITMIAGVWFMSVIISSPPLCGWNNWPTEFTEDTKCELTDDHGYRIYSSLGSFYIPLFVMTVVYLEIYIATKKRLKDRERASKLSFTRLSQRRKDFEKRGPRDLESVTSETHQEDKEDEVEEPKTMRQKMKSWMGWKRKSSKDGTEDSATESDIEENPAAATTANFDPTGDPVTPTRTKSLKSPRRPSQREITTPTSILSMVLPSPLPKRKQTVKPADVKKRISLSKERRAARTLGIIMGVFVVCWLPYFLMYVIVGMNISLCPPPKLVNFITWLGYVNSAANPAIYTIFNLDFRKAFRKLLRLT